MTEEEKDINKEAFWNHIAKNFEKATLLLKKAAEKYGMDPEAAAEAEKRVLKRKQSVEKIMATHELSVLSKEYLLQAKQLLGRKDIFENKANAVVQGYELGITTEETAISLSLQLKEYIEVVQWYLYFIHVKFVRALSSRAEENGGQEKNAFQKDSDGSAKVALIAVQRSMEAWYMLYEQLPGSEDEVLSILALLSKLKTTGEQVFPGAMRFKRPGFDEPISRKRVKGQK